MCEGEGEEEEEEEEKAGGSAQPKTRTPHKDVGKKNEFLPVDAAQKRSEFCVKVFSGEISKVERRQPLACGQF